MAQKGDIYLLCFDREVGSGAKHYLGWSSDVNKRLAAHTDGRGSKLMKLVRSLGVGWSHVRTWRGKTRHDEARMKRNGSLAQHCPRCCDEYRKRRNALQKRRRALHGRADRPRGNPRGPL